MPKSGGGCAESLLFLMVFFIAYHISILFSGICFSNHKVKEKRKKRLYTGLVYFFGILNYIVFNNYLYYSQNLPDCFRIFPKFRLRWYRATPVKNPLANALTTAPDRTYPFSTTHGSLLLCYPAQRNAPRDDCATTVWVTLKRVRWQNVLRKYFRRVSVYELAGGYRDGENKKKKSTPSLFDLAVEIPNDIGR